MYGSCLSIHAWQESVFLLPVYYPLLQQEAKHQNLGDYDARAEIMWAGSIALLLTAANGASCN